MKSMVSLYGVERSEQTKWCMIADTGYTLACPRCGVRHGGNCKHVGRDREIGIVLCTDCVGKPLREGKHYRTNNEKLLSWRRGEK
jgi:hypothetical protein